MRKVFRAAWGLFSLSLMVAGIIMTAVMTNPDCRGHRECTTAEARGYESQLTPEEKRFRALGFGVLVIGIFSSVGWIVVMVREEARQAKQAPLQKQQHEQCQT